VGYDEAPIKLVDDVMMARGVPNPRDMRLHDLLGPFGLINYRLLLAAKVVQTLADAEALLFLDRNFEEMFNRWGGDCAAVAWCWGARAVLNPPFGRSTSSGHLRSQPPPTPNPNPTTQHPTNPPTQGARQRG